MVFFQMRSCEGQGTRRLAKGYLVAVVFFCFACMQYWRVCLMVDGKVLSNAPLNQEETG